VSRARHWVLGLFVALTTLLATTAAFASASNFAPIPGATYTGTVGHGTVAITVSSDGTLVSAYSFVGINGTNTQGGGCTIGSGAATPSWGGAPISSGSFGYTQPSSFDLEGTFDGAQSVSGTVTFSDDGFSSGCATTAIHWTATTTSSPASTGSGGTQGGSSGGSGSGSGGTSGGGTTGSSKRKQLAVRISLKRRTTPKPKRRSKAKAKARSSLELVGTLKSSNHTCIARRSVILWHGRKRVGTVHSTSKGAFTFKAAKSLHNKPVRATVKAMSTTKLACGAASSTFIKD
jgi:hypothetical protein